MTARTLLRLVPALAIFVAACGGAAAAPPQSTAPKFSDQLNSIVTLARGELELTMAWAPGYLDGPNETKRLTDGFNKAYGFKIGVSARTTGASMTENSARVIDEYKRGVKATSDIVLGTESEIIEMSKAGALISEPWQSWMSGLANLRMVAAGGVAVQVQTRTPGITYNSTKLTGANVPKSLADLLKPQYKGRIATTPSTALFERLALDELWGPDRALSYARALAPQVGGTINCGDEDRINKGDFDVLVFDCGSARASQLKAKGQLIGWTEPTDGALLGYVYMGIPKNAVHPNAARLFINYLLSREAQDIMYETEFADLHVLPGSKTFSEVDRATKAGVKFYELTTETLAYEANRVGKSVSVVQSQIRDALTPKR